MNFRRKPRPEMLTAPPPEIVVKRSDFITIRKGVKVVSLTPEQAVVVRDELNRLLPS